MRPPAGFPSLLVAALLAAACSSPEQERPSVRPAPETASPGVSPSPTPPEEERFDPGAVRVELRPLVEGLSAPLLLTHAPDGSGRLFVVEQGGTVRVVRDGELSEGTFLDISDRTEASGEQGLLGLAFHPDYRRNGRFFVNYTDNAGDTVVAEYRASPPDADRVDAGTERVLLHVDQPFSNHNGGDLEFGPDGYLYVALGDGGSAGDPHENAQSLGTLLGKLLRIDVDGGDPYGVPADNPFVDEEGARPEIWAYGLRNPWRFSFDEDAGRLWIGDVGQNAVEEIDRAPADKSGLNYGWDVMEGDLCFEPPQGCDPSGFVYPIATYTHDRGCTVIGGSAYRGAEFPALRGAYLFADYCSGLVFAIDAAGEIPQEPTVVLESGLSPSSFGHDEDGEMYLTDLSGGAVYRVTAQPA